MLCPACCHPDTRVIDSRVLGRGTITRRRRECEACSERYTTYERLEREPDPDAALSDRQLLERVDAQLAIALELLRTER